MTWRFPRSLSKDVATNELKDQRIWGFTSIARYKLEVLFDLSVMPEQNKRPVLADNVELRLHDHIRRIGSIYNGTVPLPRCI